MDDDSIVPASVQALDNEGHWYPVAEFYNIFLAREMVRAVSGTKLRIVLASKSAWNDDPRVAELRAMFEADQLDVKLGWDAADAFARDAEGRYSHPMVAEAWRWLCAGLNARLCTLKAPEVG